MSGMWIYHCLTFKEMFQGARSGDMKNRRLPIQPLLKPTNPFFKISSRNVGNLGRGGGISVRGGGEAEREMEWDVLDSGCKSLDERNQTPHVVKAAVGSNLTSPWLRNPLTYMWAVKTRPDYSFNCSCYMTLSTGIHISVLHCVTGKVSHSICASLTEIEARRRTPALPDIPVPLRPHSHRWEQKQGSSFCVFIPQLDHHIFWKAALAVHNYKTRLRPLPG